MSVTAAPRSLLPAEAYRSPEWFAAEQDRLFGRTWNLVATVDDLAGDVTLITTVAGCPVRVRREDDERIVATTAKGPASVAVWACYVFVHLDPAAAPLSEHLGAFPERIGGFRPERLVEVARHRFELGANWKLFVENHIDLYHLWYLHGASLGAYDHTQARWETLGRHWVFYEPPRADVDTHADAFWRGLVPVAHVDESRWGSGAHLIWPNVTLATGAGFFMTYQCIPLAYDRSLVDLRVRAEPGSDAAAMLEMSRTVIEREDGAACEAMQAAVHSPWFRVGPLARTHELPIAWFHEQVLGAIA